VGGLGLRVEAERTMLEDDANLVGIRGQNLLELWILTRTERTLEIGPFDDSNGGIGLAECRRRADIDVVNVRIDWPGLLCFGWSRFTCTISTT